MTLIVAVICPEGIVLAADSKCTFQKQNPNPESGTPEIEGTGFTAVVDKIILTDNNVAIATQGTVMIKNQKANLYLQEFIRRHPGLGVTECLEAIQSELFAIPDIDEMIIFIAGYEETKDGKKQVLYEINTRSKRVQKNCSFNARWIGEVDIMNRLFNPNSVSNENFYDVPYQVFSLQSAIDFAVLSIEMTIRVMALQDRHQTVGFPIDVLVIKPDGTEWLQKKQLHV